MTGTPVVTYRTHRSEVLAVAWSPDGTRIASGDDDGIVRIWQAPVACQCVSSDAGGPPLRVAGRHMRVLVVQHGTLNSYEWATYDPGHQ